MSRKRMFKYAREAQENYILEGFVDASYVGNVDARKSLLSFVFTLFGTVTSWKENQQYAMTLCTTQVGIFLFEGTKKAIWLKGMIGELEVT